jgi:predicted dienelactone hydrolase
MKKWLIIAVIVVAVGAGGYWFAAIPERATPNGPQSIARYAPGPYEVSSETFTLVDDTRPTQAYNDFEGSPQRELDGEIWYPADRPGPGPLLIYSHGFMSFRQEGLYLITFLASHGYTVVAADYPLTGFYAPDGPLMTDVVNQPGDISFLIDAVLARNADPRDVLYDTIDASRIAVAGVSLGGLTSTLVSFHRQLLDPRLAAAVSIAGPASMFTPDFFTSRELPYLLIYGDTDALVPYTDNALPAFEMSRDSILVTLKGASHAGFAQPASTIMRFIPNPDVVGCEQVTAEVGDTITVGSDELIAELGGAADGVDMDENMDFCASPPIPEAMKASRQHMFTTLAVYAFLESVFADSAATRDAARSYLLQTLPEENGDEVAVTF